jgi:hypothetical protein
MTMNDPMNEAGWTGRARAIPMTDELSRAAFVETAALLEEECQMSVDFIGRHLADRRGTLTLEGTGRHLSYRLKSDGGWLFLTACPLDRGQWTEVLIVGDTVPGRQTIRAALVALESVRMRDLSKEQLDMLLAPFTVSRSSR